MAPEEFESVLVDVDTVQSIQHFLNQKVLLGSDTEIRGLLESDATEPRRMALPLLARINSVARDEAIEREAGHYYGCKTLSELLGSLELYCTRGNS